MPFLAVGFASTLILPLYRWGSGPTVHPPFTMRNLPGVEFTFGDQSILLKWLAISNKVRDLYFYAILRLVGDNNNNDNNNNNNK